uniref:Protein FREE1 isoform X1 n=1 Tax=Rhizophora mucronata TaxID=61149 RepID=A0A2P2L3B1_RHIMU
MQLFIFQAEVTQRLSNSKEATTKPAGLRSHEDLAKKLQVTKCNSTFLAMLVLGGLIVMLFVIFFFLKFQINILN